MITVCVSPKDENLQQWLNFILLIFYPQLRRAAAVCACLLMMATPVRAATFRFASSSNRIYVEGGGSGTLSEIKAALPNAPLDVVDAANAIWLLRANLFITDGSTIVLHGTAAGGDVN